jgi:hypothetical protein
MYDGGGGCDRQSSTLGTISSSHKHYHHRLNPDIPDECPTNNLKSPYYVCKM